MYRTLSNGIQMPQIGFGVFQVPESICEQVVTDAINIGYQLIDTASSYQNEEAVGKAIHTCGVNREELFITTKAYIQEMGYEQARQAFERSLRKLQIDYLDLYLIHMPLGDYYGAWRALEDLYDKGLIRAIGVCNFNATRIIDFCNNVRIRPMVNQIELHPHFQRNEELAIMQDIGIQPEAWAPFAEGLKGMFTEPSIQEIAEKHQCTIPQVILRWNIQRGAVVIPKSIHKERMVENLASTDLLLDEEDMKQIATLDKGVPSMLDLSKPQEVRRVYDYLNNPVLTTL